MPSSESPFFEGNSSMCANTIAVPSTVETERKWSASYSQTIFALAAAEEKITELEAEIKTMKDDIGQGYNDVFKHDYKKRAVVAFQTLETIYDKHVLTDDDEPIKNGDKPDVPYDDSIF